MNKLAVKSHSKLCFTYGEKWKNVKPRQVEQQNIRYNKCIDRSESRQVKCEVNGMIYAEFTYLTKIHITIYLNVHMEHIKYTLTQKYIREL